MGIFNKTPSTEMILIIKESSEGLTTYINPYLHKMNDAYKENIKSTLKKLLSQLEK